MPLEVVKECKVISTKLPCRGVKDNSIITLNLRIDKNASLFGHNNFQKTRAIIAEDELPEANRPQEYKI